MGVASENRAWRLDGFVRRRDGLDDIKLEFICDYAGGLVFVDATM